MDSFFYNLVPFAIAAVALVLVLGLFNMMRGGSANTSQKLMRARVIFQAVALVIVMAAIYFMQK
ncbi:twin transmembrane helix small protein [Rhodobium gokarnense]|uniref:HIG1 domain-containing protein n=1 Tax=Rhodobium gokarnense TaxID=364296 RepID=A0ABT3HEA7_9HYPH|nr:twin transmembrane helix small protein [Rhodobium gokarnense]MCW2308736.1 hypothetical protein [Rhodobium gokarnense]